MEEQKQQPQWELDDTSTFTLRNARGDDDLLGTDGKPVTANIYGPGSVQGRKAKFKFNRSRDLRSFRAMRGDYPPNDMENAERERSEKLTAITESLSSNSPYTAAQLFTNPKLCYLHDQFDEQFSKDGNFMKGPSAS
jgi:hypothetical protein